MWGRNNSISSSAQRICGRVIVVLIRMPAARSERERGAYLAATFAEKLA